MNTKYMFIVAAMAVMLIGATALATEDAFAGKKKGYEKSQASSQANACGNGEFISVANFCQDIDSQNQGEENSVAQSGNQAINIGVELDWLTTVPLVEQQQQQQLTPQSQ